MGSGPRLPAAALLGALALLGLPRASGDCGTLPTFPHAQPKESYITNETFVDGTTITYKCDPGYVKLPEKSDTVTCQGMEWSEIPQFCNRSCNIPDRFPTIQLAVTFLNRNYFPINSTVTFVCRPGHTISQLGKITSTCQDDGTWSPVSGSCKRKSCPHPEPLTNGRFESPNGFLYGSRITYICDEGYTLIGQTSSLCEIDGNNVVWSGIVPVCQIKTCAPPPDVLNGKHNDDFKDFFNYLETVTYQCKEDSFSLIGDATIFCNKDGQWNKSPPLCKEVRCKTPQVEHAKQLTGFGSIHKYKDAILFQCNEGYTLKNNDKITCEADNNWSPELPVCYKEFQEPDIPSTKEPPVSSHPGSSLPPNNESSRLGPGIIALIVIAIITGIVVTFIFIYREYNKKKGKKTTI
ncbi:membrane cofactor protein-like isoform X2 [Macrotis lagotis]|uniref:membrane cofactor protein-like isoform X2 n=1 Tax=Macrotis lagotis TaxID=92651 RepID=UPI003D68A072